MASATHHARHERHRPRAQEASEETASLGQAADRERDRDPLHVAGPSVHEPVQVRAPQLSREAGPAQERVLRRVHVGWRGPGEQRQQPRHQERPAPECCAGDAAGLGPVGPPRERRASEPDGRTQHEEQRVRESAGRDERGGGDHPPARRGRETTAVPARKAAAKTRLARYPPPGAPRRCRRAGRRAPSPLDRPRTRAATTSPIDDADRRPRGPRRPGPPRVRGCRRARARGPAPRRGGRPPTAPPAPRAASTTGRRARRGRGEPRAVHDERHEEPAEENGGESRDHEAIAAGGPWPTPPRRTRRKRRRSRRRSRRAGRSRSGPRAGSVTRRGP